MPKRCGEQLFPHAAGREHLFLWREPELSDRSRVKCHGSEPHPGLQEEDSAGLDRSADGERTYDEEVFNRENTRISGVRVPQGTHSIQSLPGKGQPGMISL